MKAVLFKSWCDNYQKVFENSGYNTIFIEPLQFKLTNESILEEKLTDANYNGMILTSPRAVQAVSKCFRENELSSWTVKKVYAVGEASGNKIRDSLNLKPLGHTSGNSEKLAEIIVKENPSGSRFLFPCGNLKLETIIEKLDTNGILVDAVVVYETEENENLKTNLTNLLKEKTELSLFFFSPSGASFVQKHLHHLCADISNFLFFAIGKTTSKKLEELGIHVSGIASAPTAESILETMKKALQNLQPAAVTYTSA